MRRAILVVLLVAVAVALWRYRDQPAARPPAATTTMSPTVTLPPAPPRLGAHRAPELDVTAVPPSLPGNAVPPDLEKRLTAAHDALLAAVDPCWDDPGPPRTPAGSPDATVQKLRVGYRLVVENGQAHAADVEPIDSSISDPRMDRCLLDRIRAARWVAPGPDAAMAIRDVISLGDLAMRRRPAGPT